VVISSAGLEFLKLCESVKLLPYLDTAGKLTIGVGHLLTQSEIRYGSIIIQGVSVDFHRGLSPQQVSDLLRQDLVRFERAVNKLVQVPLTQNQYDALVSFSFNVGVHNFKNSTLLKVLNQGDYTAVPDQLRKWRKSGGVVTRGLVNRREAEVKLWNS
jgi:lysozyme